MKWNKIALLLIAFAYQIPFAYARKYTDYVDPYIGSGGHGHVFVGASVPYGAVQVGPSNFFKGWDWCSGYNYRDSVIIGIELSDKYTIKGYRSSEGWAKKQQVFFAVKSSVPIHDFSIYEDNGPVKGKKAEGVSVKGLISFEKSPGTVFLKVGISPVSPDNALKTSAMNDIRGLDFDRDSITIDAMLSGCKTVTIKNNRFRNNGRYGIRTKNTIGLEESGNIWAPAIRTKSFNTICFR